MAPAYAPLFMGKFEKDFLDSSDVQPFLWFPFLDDIFMIWDDSEENLLKFLDKLKSFTKHLSLHTTTPKLKPSSLMLNCSSLKKVLRILVCLKKNTDVHQYIEFSSCHPLSCKKGIPFNQAKRYRRITSDYDCFKQDLSRLETYFKRRNYPVDILKLHSL